MSNSIRFYIARVVFAVWPTSIGLDTLMNFLKPPDRKHGHSVRNLRGYPIKIKYNPESYLGKYIYYRGLYEEGVLNKLSKLLKPEMTFLDIGANIGLYSLVASNLVGSKGRVVAFEPQANLQEFIEENLSINNLSNVVLKKFALSGVNGVAKIFQVSEKNDGQATLSINENETFVGEPESIEVRRLDEVLSDLGISKVDGVKIDTEGAELEVLKGFVGWLEDKPPSFVFFECIEVHLNRFGGTEKDLFSLLWKYEYSIYCLYFGKWREINSLSDRGKYSNSNDFLALHKPGCRHPDGFGGGE